MRKKQCSKIKAPKNVKVKGYRRKDGTKVKPHKRSRPDGIKSNNHSC